MSAIEHQLVWYASGNSDNVPGRKFLPGSTLNGATALLMRRDSFSVYQGAPHNQCSGAGLHEEYVHLSFVPLDLTVGLPVNQQEGFIGKIRKLLHGEMMWISGGFGAKCLRSVLQVRWRPMLETLQDGLLGSHNEERNRNQKHQPELFHLFSSPDFVVTLPTRISCRKHLKPLVTKRCGNNLLRCPKFTREPLIVPMPATLRSPPFFLLSKKSPGASPVFPSNDALPSWRSK